MSDNHQELTFLRKRTLVSTIPVQPSCKIHELSTLDLMMEKHILKIIYYYKTPIGLQLGELSAKIRDNFSETLSYFPVVIGRLMKDNNENNGNWVIKCNDAGLRIIEGRFSGSVEKWLENVDDENEKRLVHWEDMCDVPYFWSTFYVKVSEFEDGGLALGLSCTHMIADAISATLLLKALADIFVSGKISIPPLFHSLPHNKKLFSLIKCPHDEPSGYLINIYKSFLETSSQSPPLLDSNYKTIAMEFKDDHIVAGQQQPWMKSSSSQLDGWSSSSSSGSGSTYTYSPECIALIGVLWDSISRAKGRSDGLMDMSICSDARKILGLDQGFFGNCMIYTKVVGNGVGFDDLISSTKAIREAIETANNREEILELIRWLEHYNNDNGRPHSSSFVMGYNQLVFINLEDMSPYSNMLIQGYGPIRVSYYSETLHGKDKVLILPSQEGQLSRIVMITLPTHEIIKLCEDKHLARYLPVRIM